MSLYLVSLHYIMMLGSKAFDPSDTGLLCTACSRNPQNIRNSLIFLRKMATYSCFLAGPKFRNLPASKLASDFRPFDPDILSCSGLLYNLSCTHIVHIYQSSNWIFPHFTGLYSHQRVFFYSVENMIS